MAWSRGHPMENHWEYIWGLESETMRILTPLEEGPSMENYPCCLYFDSSSLEFCGVGAR